MSEECQEYNKLDIHTCYRINFMPNNEFEEVFNQPFISLEPPGAQHVRLTPRGDLRFVARGPLPFLDLNDHIADTGTTRVIQGTDGQPEMIALDAPTIGADNSVQDNVRVVIHLHNETVEWKSTNPVFPYNSSEPVPIGIVRVGSALGSAHPDPDFGEITYILDQMGNAVSNSGLPQASEILQVINSTNLFIG
jgi:hypothetical protein